MNFTSTQVLDLKLIIKKTTEFEINLNQQNNAR